MSKYIPAIKVVDHFNATKYELSWSTEASDSYQDALNHATELRRVKLREKPITRVDGLEFRDKSVTPVVLKEVVMKEADS